MLFPPRSAMMLGLLLLACAKQGTGERTSTNPDAGPEPAETIEPGPTGGVLGGIPGGVVAGPPPPPPLGEPSNAWQEAHVERLGFRAPFPHPPVVEGTVASSADDVIHVSVDVMVLPIEARFSEPDAWLRSWATTLTSMYGPAEAQRLEVAGRPALDLIAREPYLRTTRFVHAEDRVFVLEAIVPEGADADGRTERFLDGFVLVSDVVDHPPSVDEAPWTTSSSTLGGYRVDLPSADPVAEENARTGQRVAHFAGMFSVSYEPRPSGTTAKALAHAAAQPQGDADVIDEIEIEAAGLVGVEARYALSGPEIGTKVGVQRVLIADDRIYRLLVVYDGSDRLAPVIARFLSSFSTTNGAG